MLIEKREIEFTRTAPGQLRRFQDALSELSVEQMLKEDKTDELFASCHPVVRSAKRQKEKREASKTAFMSILPKPDKQRVAKTTAFYADMVFDNEKVDGPSFGGDDLFDLRGMLVLAQAIGMKIDINDAEDEGIWER